jgi:hypothetical protein
MLPAMLSDAACPRSVGVINGASRRRLNSLFELSLVDIDLSPKC